MTEYGRRCHDRAGSALLDLDQTHLGEFSADWRPTRSLNPGGRSAQQPDAVRYATSMPPGRTDRGGLVADGGVSPDDLTECWCCGTVSERPRCNDCRAAGCDHFGGKCRVDGAGENDKQTIDSSAEVNDD